jgi:Na+/citrate or Na+/malate symporter
MSDQQTSPRILRSIGAVLAGIVVGVALTLGTDVVLHSAHFFPPWGEPVASGPLALATCYRSVFGVAAAYLTARLAPSRPMAHALAGGLIGLVASTIGAIATWNRGPAFGPHWYPVALIVLALPTAWLGGKLVPSRPTK